MRVSSISKFLIACTALMVLGMITSYSAEAPSQKGAKTDHLKLLLNFTIDYEQPQFFVAREKGYYAANHLTVDIIPGTGSSTTVKAVAGGVADIGVADVVSIMQAIAAGIHLTTVGVLLQQNPMAIICAPGAHVNQPSDLAGKRIGTILGGAPYLLLQGFLKTHGIGLDKVKIVGLASAGVAEIQAGRIDCMNTFSPVTALYESVGIKPTVLRAQDLGQDAYGLAFFVRDEWLTQPGNPDKLRRFLRATEEGVSYAIGHPSESLDFEKSANPAVYSTGRDGVVNAFKLLSQLFKPRDPSKGQFFISPSVWESTYRLLVSIGQIKETPAILGAFTNEYAISK